MRGMINKVFPNHVFIGEVKTATNYKENDEFDGNIRYKKSVTCHIIKVAS